MCCSGAALAYKLQDNDTALGWITGETKSGHAWIAILNADKEDSLLAMIDKKQGVYLASCDDGSAIAQGRNLSEVLSVIAA